ncbi:MAG: ATP-binding cassette domain-containing protein [Candidatus Omnitrophota bacterium]
MNKLNEKIIEVKDIRKTFGKRGVSRASVAGSVKAVDGVSFCVEKAGTFGLVGESGCGKTTLAGILAGILRPDSGEVIIRGDKDMVFQDPYGSLNPRMVVEEIVGESLLVRGAGKKEIKERVLEILDMVRLDGKNCIRKYPHQFSGGERQRIAIARALVRRPDILILDEPVSSLDVSIQAGILNLLKDLQEELGLTYIFISHDLRVVEFMSDTVGVMRAGRLEEIASREELYSNPKSAYTRRLLEAIP